MKNWKWLSKPITWGESLKVSAIITAIYVVVCAVYCVVYFWDNITEKIGKAFDWIKWIMSKLKFA